MSGEAVARPLLDLTAPMPPLTVLFDRECPFCRWTVERLRRWDRSSALRLRPYQETRDQPGLPGLVVGRSLGRALHVVDAAGRYAAGGDAVLVITSLLPGGRPVARLVVAVPPARMLVRAGYRLVERLRPWLSAAGFDGPVLRERNTAFDEPTG